MEMSKSNDLIKAKNLVPPLQQQYRSWELGLQITKNGHIFINQTGSGRLIRTTD